MDILISEIRALVEDFAKKEVEYFSYDSDNVFPLTESNIIENSVKVYKNSIELVAGWTIDYDSCKITITDPLIVGDNIEIRYNCYSQYSNTEIKEYIKGSLCYLSQNKIGEEDFELDDDGELYPSPEIKERRLIAIITAILINPDLKSYRTPDFNISYQIGDSKDVKIKKLFRDYKSAIGVFATIEMNTNTDFCY